MNANRVLAASAMLVATLIACAPSSTERRDLSTRSAMQQILAALEVALPASLSEERYTDPANRDEISASLRTLASSAASLESHGRSAGFRVLGEALAQDAAEVSRRYDEGRYAESRFILEQITQDCVACHTRLPGPESQLGRQLTSKVQGEDLSDEERVRLAIATRQFDVALTSCEQLFAYDGFSPTALQSRGLLVDYLVIAVRVREQPARARRTLEAVQARDEGPGYFRQRLDEWIDALRDLEENPPVGSQFEQAQALMERGNERARFPADRAPLVYYLAASGRLERLLEAETLTSSQQSEAYYWLGLTESVLRWPTWASPRYAYLEEAIRVDPASPAARPAFSLLVLELSAAYGGSSGIFLPDDELATLDELYALIEQAQGSEPEQESRSE